MNSSMLSPAYVETYKVVVSETMEKWLLKEINNGSDKLYLLRNRVEPRKKKSPIPMSLCQCHYLAVDAVDHC